MGQGGARENSCKLGCVEECPRLGYWCAVECIRCTLMGDIPVKKDFGPIIFPKEPHTVSGLPPFQGPPIC